MAQSCKILLSLTLTLLCSTILTAGNSHSKYKDTHLSRAAVHLLANAEKPQHIITKRGHSCIKNALIFRYNSKDEKFYFESSARKIKNPFTRAELSNNEYIVKTDEEEKPQYYIFVGLPSE